MRRLVPVLVVLLVMALGVGGWAAFLRQPEAPTRTTTVQRRAELAATIRATGRVDVLGRLAVPLPLAGQVRLLAVRPGDSVRAGEVLLAMDDARPRQTVQSAGDALDAAQYALTAARNDNRGDLTAIVTAEQRVREAQRVLDDARIALGRTLVVAPTDGTVLTVAVVERQTYNQGQEALVLANLQNLVLNADIDELDVPRLPRDNREARITFDAFPGQPVTGRLVGVAPLATNRGGRTIYEGQITFTPPPGLDLRPGMGADITIATRIERDVLVLPDLAIETIGQRMYVTVLRQDGNRERVEVRTGIRATGFVVIASGVDEGTRVVLP